MFRTLRNEHIPIEKNEVGSHKCELYVAESK